MADLVLLSKKPAVLSGKQTDSVQNCLIFLTELLIQADKSPENPTTTVLVRQLASLATRPPPDLRQWVERVFLGPSGAESNETRLFRAVSTAKEFFFFVDILRSATR